MVPVAPVMPMMRRIRVSGLPATGSSLLVLRNRPRIYNPRPPRAQSRDRERDREPRAESPEPRDRGPRDQISSSSRAQAPDSRLRASARRAACWSESTTTTCYNCGRRNPGMWGFAPALRALGGDLGFVPIRHRHLRRPLRADAASFSGGNIGMGGLFSMLVTEQPGAVPVWRQRALPVFAGGRWWTILSAGWLHGGALHIFFNMMCGAPARARRRRRCTDLAAW